ncbi:tetratricopeptide repeat protein [Shewanella japonica]|uniref:tetratricopeptide repeat protein n=1 Tax=Shewanella japonica TaxID=93973 RepID=UPI000E732A6C|nr:tetratricopeptide repeat protein [Shewanella japonica]
MRKLIPNCLAFILLIISIPALAIDPQEREIEFNETPQALFDQLLVRTQFPLSFNNRQEFELIAKELKYTPDELQADLETLARLYMETVVRTPNKTENSRLLTQQLESIAVTPMQEAMILLLEARFRGIEDQQYKQSIILFKEALKKIASIRDEHSLTLQFVLHGGLSSLHAILKQDTQALYHYKSYREIAYQLRNDYFIAQSETAIGKYYTGKNQLAKALQHHSEAYRISNRLNYPVIQAHAQFQLSRAYRDLGQWDEALKNANEAAISFQELGHEALQSNAMTVIAMVYGNQKQWNKAIDYYLNAQQLDKKNNQVISQGLNFHNIGEAYMYLDNYPSSVSYLKMANEIFKSRRVMHYLVYNELLFAEVMSKQALWEETITHAKAALVIAEEKQLIDAQKEALSFLSKAYRGIKDDSSALEMMDKLVAIDNEQQENIVDEAVNSNLNEEKLKFEINVYQNKLNGYIKSSKDQQMAIIILLAAIFILSFVWLYSLKRINTLKQKQQSLTAKVIQDPLTEVKGYRGMLDCMSTGTSPKTVALVNIKALTDLDIDFGLSESKLITESLIQQFEKDLPACVYVIKPGEFAFCFKETFTANETLKKIEASLASQDLAINTNIPNYSVVKHDPLECIMGHINLPLLANPDLRLTNDLQFETVQYALAAAKTIDKGSTYVSIRTLNFAPAAIFFKPLYLNLTHALQRGIIRAESNRPIAEIKWPTN